MRDIRAEFSDKEIINMFDDTYVVRVIANDDYYREVLAIQIRLLVPTLDKEDQVFYNDLRDDRILINAFVDACGASDVIDLMLEARYGNDIVNLLEQQYGLDEEE